MDDLKMPERHPADGPVAVNVVGNNAIQIATMTAGVTSTMIMSRHNAWRVFGMLAVMLGLPLSAKVGKAIKF